VPGTTEQRYHSVCCCWPHGLPGAVSTAVRGGSTPPNKRMQLTKLRAAPERQDKVPPCAPAGQMDGGTASQLIRRVRRTRG
jgi:hypothetical protein